MTVSYSSNLRLTLPGDGDLSGTWGGAVNAGITQTLEQAISGRVVVAMTDADYTLSALNGVSDEARAMVLRITGTLTNTRNVIVPNAAKLWIVENATTGGFPIIVKTAAGTGLTITSGNTAPVRSDGTNVTAWFGYLPGSLVVSGTVGATVFVGALAGNATTATTAGSLSGTVALANGGTGATTAVNARTALGAAESGANSSITSLSGLTTPLSVAQGGTGSTSGALPAGAIIDWPGTFAPTGYVICPLVATNVLRTGTYAGVFANLGTTWGVGDGSTTFGVPFFPADYAAVQANANVGTQTTGDVKAHLHAMDADGRLVAKRFGSDSFDARSVAASAEDFNYTGDQNTGSTGGAGNLAAGVRVLKCMKL